MSSADTETTEDEEVVETDEAREAVVAQLEHLLGDILVAHHIVPGKDLFIRVTAEGWKRTFQVLRHELSFGFFEFLSAIDWMPSPYGRYEDTAVDEPDPDAEPYDPTPKPGYTGGDTRMQVFGRVFDIEERHFGVTVKADVADDAPAVESIIAVYPGANWHERECHEMFGVDFVGHPFLAPLYLPSGFEGHPLRKDFPLVARMVKPWPGIVDVEPMPDDGDDDEGGDE